MRIRRQKRSPVRAAYDRYEAILEAAAEGIYGLDAEGRVTFVNAAAEDLTGWPRQEQIGKYQHELIHHSYPDGAPYPVELCPIYDTLRTGETHSGEEAYRCRDGSVLPITFTSVPLRGKKGGIVGAVITFSDRTVQLAQRRYKALVEATSDYVWRCDPEGAVIEVDPVWLRLSGQSERDALGWGWMDLIPADERADYEQRRASGIKTGKPFSSEYMTRGPGGGYHWVEERLVPVVDADGVIQEWVGIGRDITDKKREEEELQTQALRDPLTKAYNRRHLQMAVEEEIARCQRSGEGFSLLLIDLDHFKAINDKHGHDAGDQVLRTLVEVLSEGIRRSDTLARWGGEEFAVLLAGARRADASRVAELLRSRVERWAFGFSFPVTMSIGVAEYQKDESVADLVRRADEVLYKAKNSGRNRVVTSV